VARGDPALDRVMDLQDFDHALLSRAIFEETNVARQANGAPPLAGLPALDDAADMQANYMALTLAAGHYSIFPHQHDVAERVARAGVDAAAVGENAIMMPARRPPGSPGSGYTYREYGAFLVDGWMNSPDHRVNMLAVKFTYLGCAGRLASGLGRQNEEVLATQVFLRPAATAEVQPQPDSSWRLLNRLASHGSAQQ
jgi:uncharacterized protein YkwD